MKTSKDLKKLVKDKYAGIVMASREEDCGCSCGCGSSVTDYSVFNDPYAERPGYLEQADLGLGCGIPTDYAGIRPGDHVLDLGSGAGNDCFVARALAGEKGKVTGLDFTPQMIKAARNNARKLGYTNVEFVLGDIENMPLAGESVDVVISNCVLNLVPDKNKAFSEIFRVLRPGGRFCISDVVLAGKFPEKLKAVAELYAGCVSGAIEKDEYLKIINSSGFTGLKVWKEKEIVIPQGFLEGELNGEELKAFQESGVRIFSITLSADK